MWAFLISAVFEEKKRLYDEKDIGDFEIILSFACTRQGKEMFHFIPRNEVTLVIVEDYMNECERNGTRVDSAEAAIELYEEAKSWIYASNHCRKVILNEEDPFDRDFSMCITVKRTMRSGNNTTSRILCIDPAGRLIIP